MDEPGTSGARKGVSERGRTVTGLRCGARTLPCSTLLVGAVIASQSAGGRSAAVLAVALDANRARAVVRGAMDEIGGGRAASSTRGRQA